MGYIFEDKVMENKTVKIENFLKSNLTEDEVVLWQGKPDMKILFKEEKINNFHLVANILLMILFISIISLFSKKIIVGLYFIIFFTPISIFIAYRYLNWWNRKKNTYFIITNQRIIDIFTSESILIMNFKLLIDIDYFEIRYLKKGYNLHMGKYKFNFSTPFNYNTGNIVSVVYSFNTLIVNSFVKFMNNIDYFCFFDLKDVDTPAALIREYAVNAVEYIDPKLKK